ncbi:nuclear transport factor 2 family protein [Stenotrophomonas sp. MMGLT7]|uniref:nuclear transport factor 2 family protein n=1 Tax=Stenotrophomonas sp. MMGLT7 TaxID=2901227 RepID=UPI001E49907A|nr:nuclear transport factor 2 family protein [Stenotrophomonas sp. MMGLT7]MCD7099738.1 nuclear transport factor 2 family protein [Stenotrophomonas sp. MMGLT7]
MTLLATAFAAARGRLPVRRPSLSMRTICASLLCLALALPPAHAADADAATAIDNAALVRGAFEDWRTGRGSVFKLLADDVEWTVAGDSPVSGVYRSRQDFLERAAGPITARLSTPIVPEVKHVVAQGDAVVVIWDGTATTRDGETYRNSYAWHMVLDNGRITRVVAFLDTWALERLMR